MNRQPVKLGYRPDCVDKLLPQCTASWGDWQNFFADPLNKGKAREHMRG